MKAIIHVNHAEHQRTHGAAMKAGLEAHGIAVDFAPFDQPGPCDIAVVWGYRQQNVIAHAPRLLVMERGHLPDRMVYTSCGWGGLCGRATYPAPIDGGARWAAHFASLMKPWKGEGDGANVLVCGQVTGDASLYGLREGFEAWAMRACEEARAAYGIEIVYRPHPLMVRRGETWHPEGTRLSTGPLDGDLADARACITYNSTAGVEAVLAGVPTVAMDIGSMATPVASKKIGVDVRPDRLSWAHALAWTSWTMDEIADGTAWEALETCL